MVRGKKMALSAARQIADYMGRTFMEYTKVKGRWIPRKGTVLLLRAAGRGKYEIRIAGAREGQYRFPFNPLTFTATELDGFVRFVRAMNFNKAKRKMKRLKNSKTIQLV